MDELGHILREARETKGLTLAEVQDKTRINAHFLEALENGDYAVLPTPVHARGFLRNYARYLGLDPQPLLDRHQINQSQLTQQPTITNTPVIESTQLQKDPLRARKDQPFFDPVNVEVTANQASQPRNTEPVMRVIIIIALIGTLYLIGSQFIPRLFGNDSNRTALTESINNTIQNLINGEETTTDNSLTPDSTIEPSNVISSTSRNIIPTLAATRPRLPATMETIELKIEVLERAFMEITIDGDVVFSGQARKEDVFEWTAQDEAIVNTGNAIGIYVTINEIELGRLGNRGENVEETWNTTN